MLGLYGMINLGARSLQAQRTGAEVTGHNIANANNPAYSRQRLKVETSTALPTPIGAEGTGVDIVSIERVRDLLLDGQIQVETSVTGSLTAQQSALNQTQAALGQSLDSSASSNAASGANATGTDHGIGTALSSFFNELQNLANDPTSMSERQVLLMKASDLASRFNQVDSRLGAISSSLDQKVTGDVDKVNQLLTQIADLNHQISAATLKGTTANDLMDTRQSKIEELSGLIKVDVAQGENNSAEISVNGISLVAGDQVVESLQTYQEQDGPLLIRTRNSGETLDAGGGSIQGTLAVRDGALKNLRDGINALATSLITQINDVHSAGYSLTGDTGALFFNGTSAADIQVNDALMGNPALIQTSGSQTAKGDNATALAMAQIASKTVPELGGQTFNQSYATVTAALGQSASMVNNQIEDQNVVANMLTQQRNSLSGVSLDEEMANMMTYQKAFQASAKIVSTVDEMLTTIIGMKQ